MRAHCVFDFVANSQTSQYDDKCAASRGQLRHFDTLNSRVWFEAANLNPNEEGPVGSPLRAILMLMSILGRRVKRPKVRVGAGARGLVRKVSREAQALNSRLL